MERAQINSDLNVGSATHQGMTGKHNEDSFGLFAWNLDNGQTLNMGVVADGVGGQIAGEVASRLAVDSVQSYFDEQEQVENVSGHLEQAILAANEAVYRASQDNPEYQGMSTTIAVAAILADQLYTAHVGDSRIYLLREGRLQQLSIDHTWAQEAIDAGLLTREQAKTHPNRNVIRRHLGGRLHVEVDHRLMLEPEDSDEMALSNQGTALYAGDTLLVCSDGLTDMIDDDSVLRSLDDHYFALDAASQELIDKANEAGGRDNITVVLMQVTPVIAPAVAVATEPAIMAVRGKRAKSAKQTTRSGRRPLTLLFIAGVSVILLLILAGGGLFLLNNINSTPGSESTPEATETRNPGPVESVQPLSSPQTAIVPTTSDNASPIPTESPLAPTPGLEPTLKSTSTKPPRAIVLPTATNTISLTVTITQTSASESSTSGPSGSSDLSDTPTPQTSTDLPSPTDLPVPISTPLEATATVSSE
jgi:protein phosphatase